MISFYIFWCNKWFYTQINTFWKFGRGVPFSIVPSYFFFSIRAFLIVLLALCVCEIVIGTKCCYPSEINIVGVSISYTNLDSTDADAKSRGQHRYDKSWECVKTSAPCLFFQFGTTRSLSTYILFTQARSECIFFLKFIEKTPDK